MVAAAAFHDSRPMPDADPSTVRTAPPSPPPPVAGARDRPAVCGRLCEIGMVGLGVMGRNLLLNMADHGHPVAGYDRVPGKVAALGDEAGARGIQGARTLRELVGMLRVPRAVMVLVPAGPPVDAVLRELLPLLDPGDLVIDGGNSHFSDMGPRTQALAGRGVLLLGLGISGGEHGARHGPSLMPGGPPAAYERVRPLLESIAARVNGEPCVAYLGPGAAGHYVKMVHNGIEYGVMQLIAETYDLMKRGLGASNDRMRAVYERWQQGDLNSYLIGITADICGRADERTGLRLVDEILGEAAQTGTGMWTSQEAMAVGVPLPTIDAAVSMRNLSAMERERVEASRVLAGGPRPAGGDDADLVDRLGDGLHAAMIITYAQAMALLRVGSATHGYNLDLGRIARVWRGGCIIRAGLLEGIADAFGSRGDLANLLLDPALGRKVLTLEDGLRRTAAAAATMGIPAPALMVSLAYLDTYRSAWSPANLIQAQRDYFGSHTYGRTDEPGSFHTQWQAP